MRNSWSFAHRPDAWGFGKHDAATTGAAPDAMRERGEQLRLAVERRRKLEERIQAEQDKR